MPISLREITLTATALKPLDQVILGNSITLRPGTLALESHNGVIKVYSLTEAVRNNYSTAGWTVCRVAEMSSRLLAYFVS